MGDRLHNMPGTNLTRDEAATRAALLDVTAYTVDLDLTSATQPEATTFVSTTTLEFTCRETGVKVRPVCSGVRV